MLLQPDPVCHLLPFLAAATPVGDTVVDLTTIYQTLRYLPSALDAARESFGCDKHDAAIPRDGQVTKEASISHEKSHKGLYSIILVAIVGILGFGFAAL